MKAVINLQLKNAIILAAGASERLGQPKALVEINGETLTEIIIKRLKKHNLDIIIVTRSKSCFF
jgi:molybdopterin-guanine dinucleotide biosynthesis protein A